MDLADWLKGLGLERYEPVFRENRIDYDLLPKLTTEDLKDLGVTLVGDRRRLLQAIAALREGSRSVQASAERGSAGDAERRQITVLFCDMVDSTALATKLDPEDLRAVITSFQRSVAQIIGEFDGFLAKYMGDGVLVYFGYPRAQEHDAERAVRAGLALLQAASRIESPQKSVRLRVGVATGLVVVGDLIGSGSAQEQTVVGETPNLAARLQSLAAPNQLLVCPTTRRLIGDLFTCKNFGPRNLKGFAKPVQVTQVLGESVGASRFQALRAASLIPLVGREEQVELLQRRWERAKGGAGQVVLISGEPGLGKSRLVVALQDDLKEESHIRLRYFCSPHHSDSALYPFVTQLEHAAAIERDDTPETKLSKLRALLTRSSATTEELSVFVDLLSLSDADGGAAGIEAERRRGMTLRAFLRQIDDLAASSPVLMVFEDAHWSDPTSIDLLNATVDRIRTLPVLLIATFRPEFQPRWASEPHVTMLILNRLDAYHTAQIVAQIAGDRPLPPAIVDQIVDRTDGIPLFIEELTRTVLESGALNPDGTYVRDGPVPALAIPSTLQASLLARLDRLPASREIAQIGAAIGREFSHRLLAAVADRTDIELRAALDGLHGAGLVSQRGVVPDTTYVFKHALVQDAAYATLLRATRQRIHNRIAAALENGFPSIAQTQPELIAHHYAEAKALAKAAQYWLAAGRNNSRRSAHVEAVRLFDRALGAIRELPEDQFSRELELAVNLGLVPCLMAVGTEWERTRDVARRTVALCEELRAVDRAVPAIFAEIFYHSSLGYFETALQLSHRIVEIGSDLRDTATLLAGHRSVGSCLVWLGDLEAAQQHLEKALAIGGTIAGSAPAMGADFDHHAAALVLYGHLKLRRGDLVAGWRFHDEAWQLANGTEHTSGLTLAFILLHRLISEALTSNLSSLQRTAQLLAEVCERRDIIWWRHMPDLFMKWGAMKVSGEVDALPELLALVDRHRQNRFRTQLPFYLKLTADLLIAAGEFAAAEALLCEIEQMVDATGQIWVKPELYRLRAVLAQHGADSTGSSSEQLLAMSLEQARKYHEKYAELCAARDLARLYINREEQKKSNELLGPLCDDFVGGSDNIDLQQAKALLKGFT